jgi:hypothetical protein
MNKNIVIAILVLIVVCCVGVSLLAIAGVVIFNRYSDSNTPVGALPTEEAVLIDPASTTQIPSEPAPTRQPAGTAVAKPTIETDSQLPADVAAQMDNIEQKVSQLRGLLPVNPVQRGLLSTDELRAKMEEDIYEYSNPEEIADSGNALSILGLLPPDFDLQALYVELMTEQVAGFYDPETKEMYVVQGGEFKGPERMTYAHEFTHVLQDQTYDLLNGLNTNPDYCEENTEYCAAVNALIEGDATLTESLWFFRYATAQDKQEVQDFYSSYTSPIYDSTPYYLQQDLLFSYQYGLEFVHSLYDVNGFASVDEAFRNPPVSTEQILHPERYPDDVPVEVALPDLSPALGEGWREIDKNVMGEWSTYMILTAGYEEGMRMDEGDAADATEGWGGDAYAIFRNDGQDQSALVLRTRWDTRQDLNEFWNAMKTYGRLRWGTVNRSDSSELVWSETADGSVLVYRNSEEVVWIIAPDATATAAVRAALGE